MSGSVAATVSDVLALVPGAGDVGSPSSGSMTVVSSVPAAKTVTYLGLVLTSVAGARTPGSNDFDGSLATPALIAADMLAAIQDPANAWATVITATLSSAVISLTSIAVGYNTFGSIVSDDTSITVTGMAGGEIMLERMLATATAMIAACWEEKICDGTTYLTLHFVSSMYPALVGGKPLAKSTALSGRYATSNLCLITVRISSVWPFRL